MSDFFHCLRRCSTPILPATESHAMPTQRTIRPSRFASWGVVAMLVMISAPVALTLHTAKTSAFQPLAQVVSGNPSPYGYSVSLLIFVVPVLLIGFWFLPQDHIRVSKRAFWWTIRILFPLGAALDFFLAQFFFRFPNPKATLGVWAPALGHPVPIEEYFFYLTGFLAILLLYIWLDGYWLHAYSVPEDDTQRISFDRLLGFHAKSLILGVVLIGGAVVLRKLAQPRSPGFPGYLTFLVLLVLLPSVGLYGLVKRVINWRALSLTVFILLLTSLLWEATLAIPYGWWAYEPATMVGVYIRAWDNLPIEAVFVWIAVTFSTVLVYETIRCWHASGKRALHAFFGKSVAAAPDLTSR
jgi:hypothetical protein